VPDPLPIRSVVEAILGPFVDILDGDPEGGLRWMKIFSQLALAEDQLRADELGTDLSVTELFLAAASRAIPDIDEPDAQRRAAIAMYSMVMVLVA
jgi:hypothetical protein